jgi:hypothetical protein
VQGALKKRDKERESMETEMDKMRFKLGDIKKKKEDQRVSGVKNVSVRLANNKNYEYAYTGQLNSFAHPKEP